MMRVFNILNAHSMCIFVVFNILNHNTTFSQDWECGQIFSCLECVWPGGRFIFLLLHYLGKDQQAAEPVNIAPYLTDTADSKDKEQTTKGDRNQRGIIDVIDVEPELKHLCEHRLHRILYLRCW